MSHSERIVRCTCGGLIVAPPADWKIVAVVINRHQQSVRHVAWWKAAEWY